MSKDYVVDHMSRLLFCAREHFELFIYLFTYSKNPKGHYIGESLHNQYLKHIEQKREKARAQIGRSWLS